MTVKLAFPFVGDTIGGSHVSAALLMATLPKHGFAPVAVIHRRGPLESWLLDRRIDVLRADLPFVEAREGRRAAIVGMLPRTLRLAAFLREHRFVLLHSNDARMTATWMPAARLAGIAALAHQRTKWAPSRQLYYPLRLAQGILSISDFVHASLPQRLSRRSRVVANPVRIECYDREQSQQAIRSETGFSAPILAFIGTLQRQKRPDQFLKTARIVRRTMPDARFVVIGRDGESTADVRALAGELKLAEYVAFMGFRADAMRLLAGCDLLIAPAVDEGFGRTLVEAMLSGVPVIAAASGGHVELVSDGVTGVLVPPDNPQDTAAAALRLLNLPALRDQLIKNARAWAMQQFSAERHASAVARFYQQVLR